MRLFCVVTIALLLNSLAGADDRPDLATSLREFPARVLTEDKKWTEMLSRSARAGIEAANNEQSEHWRRLKSRDDWEKYRDERIARLRESLGPSPVVPTRLTVHETGTIVGDGYVVENIVFESRPGLVVTANAYRPSKPMPGAPGIVICHSHHNPKTQGELQHMSIGWARQGAVVIVPDMLGHGERRQHPFDTEKAYAGKFRLGRQDYYFRYNVAMQLHLAGESLIGWMAWDLMRCVDVLLQRYKVNAEKVALLGSVAGGGDPAAVTAALDRRIKVAVIFNFGGPQPESGYPLPADAETSFNYAGGGSWESTRNLRLSARDGFLPWVIVASIAPRKLIYAHEFSWDRDHDPVWKRLTNIYEWYGAADDLAAAQGFGRLTGQPPDASHCNNIGSAHLKSMAPALKRWLGLDPPDSGGKRHSAEALRCLTAAAPLVPKPVHRLAAEHAQPRPVPPDVGRLPGEAERVIQKRALGLRLGVDLTPKGSTTIDKTEMAGDIQIERGVITIESSFTVPFLLFIPPRLWPRRRGVVVAFSQDGKAEMLKRQATEVAKLLDAGVAVCLPDLRGLGETRPGDGHGRTSSATAISATEWMLGRTLLGGRLNDLLALLAYLRSRPEVSAEQIALWGDSGAQPNPAGADLAVPLDVEPLPRQAEPLGDLLAILSAAVDERVAVVYTSGGVAEFRDAMSSPFVYVPHDVIIPGFVCDGDMAKWTALIAPRPLLRAKLVDARNRPLSKSPADTSTAWLLKQMQANKR